MNQRPRQIVYVISGLGTGGAEAMLTRLVTATPRLADAMIVVSLLPAQVHADHMRNAGVSVIELNFSGIIGPISGLIRLAKLIATRRPEIVQGWMYHGDLAALLALAMSGRRRRTSLIWSIRCSEFELSHYSVMLRLVVKACTLLSRRPDVVTANSYAGMKDHIALGYRPRHCEVIPNGIDTDIFKPDASARTLLRQQLGIADDCLVVAHVARVDPLKDQATFLAAMAQLPDLKALMIGDGTENLPAAPNILRLGRRHDVPALLAAADLVVSSSVSEGFSNVIAEGMACGLPPIATDVGDAREIIGETGLIVRPRDPGALADAIRTLAAETAAQRIARGRSGTRPYCRALFARARGRTICRAL